MKRAAPRKTLVRTAGVLVGLVGLASCGSRTGLFIDTEVPFDPPTDAEVVDASLDVQLVDDRNNVPDVIEEPITCVPGTFTLAPATSQLMFVLDRSRSMRFRLDRNDDAPPAVTSRWSALRDALDQVITPFSGQIAMGARFYPTQFQKDGDDISIACSQDPPDVAITPALNNAASILSVFRNTTPIGGTPTAEALALAARDTGPRRSVARAIVVATDGAPNCNSRIDPNTCVCTAPPAPPPCGGSSIDGSNCLDDGTTVNVIRQIYEGQKIPVFVVGIGVTSGFASTLDAMAIAGGRPRSGATRYYPAETPAELGAAFTVVRDSVAKCSYVTPSAPLDPDLIEVKINGQSISRDLTHVSGWDWIDQEFGQLQLFGAACANATSANVDGTVTCENPESGAVDAGPR